MSSRKNSVLYLIGAAVIPMGFMLLMYAALGIYPFGEKTILTIDLNNQYISFYSYLREILKGNHSFIYTFSKTLGGDMVGLSAYYLLSPLNLILCLFSTETLPTGVLLITLLKLGLSGAAFYLCISREEKTWQCWIFSTAYALMAYNIVYQQNLMWLDGVILLPLIILGIRRICQKKSPFLYLVSLFGAIVTNYYIGFMLCMFSVLYFVFAFCFENHRKRFWDWPLIGNYVLASLLSGGLGMWVVLPVLRSLQGGKASFDLSTLTMVPNFYWSDFPVKLFLGSFDYEQVKTGLPNIYCGTITLLFLGLFFLNQKISIKKKAGAIFLFVVLFFSFYINGINLIWHGFNPPAWFPYRYSFVFSALMLLFAWEGFQKARELSLKRMALFSGVAVAVLVAVAFYISRKPFAFMTGAKYLFSAAVVIVAALVFVLYLKRKKSTVLIGILVLYGVELCINGISSLQAFHYREYESYQAFVKETEPAVDYVKALDDSFYRMEKTFVSKECDPMLLDYKGLSHYSSTEKTAVKYFMGQSGFRNNGSWSYYNRGSTYAMDSLLGVRYILSKADLAMPYEKLDTVGEVGIYQNPKALPIGFMADERILDFAMDEPHKFKFQNDFWASLCPGVHKEIFQEEQVENAALHNLKKDGERDGFYIKKNKDKKAYLEYTFTAKSSNPVFAYLGTNEMHNVQIRVNGKSLGKYFNTYQYDIMRLGTFQKGDKVTLQVILKEDTVNITDVWFYHQDMEVFEEYYRNLSQNPLQLESYSDTRLLGTVTSQGETKRLFLTIPNEPSWQAYVDGVKSEISTAAGIFISVEIPEGTHQIELQYIPQGMHTGRALSLISLAVIVLWAAARIYVRKRK